MRTCPLGIKYCGTDKYPVSPLCMRCEARADERKRIIAKLREAMSLHEDGLFEHGGTSDDVMERVWAVVSELEGEQCT